MRASLHPIEFPIKLRYLMLWPAMGGGCIMQKIWLEPNYANYVGPCACRIMFQECTMMWQLMSTCTCSPPHQLLLLIFMWNPKDDPYDNYYKLWFLGTP